MTRAGWVRLAVVLVAAGLAAAGLVAGRSPDLLAAWIDDGLRTARDLGPAGGLLFAAVQVLVAVSGVLPASLLGVAAEVGDGPRGTDARVEARTRVTAAERLVAYRTRHAGIDPDAAESLEEDDIPPEALARHRRPGRGGPRRR